MTERVETAAGNPQPVKQRVLAHRRMALRNEFLVEGVTAVPALCLNKTEELTREKIARVDRYGTNAVPIMTIHKSKGLEYHTVVFVGFEDSAFWNFQKKPTEETCTFFVAFSRAKNRVVFTFCEHRAKPADAPLEPQHRDTVGPLYAILEEAGVHIEHINE